MSSFVGSSGNYGSVAAASSINSLEALTVMLWVYPTDLSTNGTMVCKNDSGATLGWHLSRPLFGTGPTAFQLGHKRATTLGFSRTVSGTLVANTWNWICGCEDTSAAPTLIRGDLSTLASECSYEAGASAGAGSAVDDSSKSIIVTCNAVGGAPTPGRYAYVQVFNRRMTVAEAVTYQFRPRNANGCVLYLATGWAGIATTPDWSGNGNSMSITGSPTLGDGVPLGSPFGWDAPYAAVAAAGAAVGSVAVRRQQTRQRQRTLLRM